MERRRFIEMIAGGLLAAPLVADAQQPGKVPRVGFLTVFSPSDFPLWREGFRQGLRDFGYTEGQNIVIEYRYAEGQPERLLGLAAELVRLKVDIIAAETTPANLAVQQATATIPLVMTLVADPVGVWSRLQLGPTGGKHYGTEPPTPGHQWQTPTAPPGVRPHGLSGGHSLELGQSKHPTTVQSGGGGSPGIGGAA
jgi:putative ABC transport system substrate-binding protein